MLVIFYAMHLTKSEMNEEEVGGWKIDKMLDYVEIFEESDNKGSFNACYLDG